MDNIRTTVIIPKELLKAAKLAAIERQTSVSGLIQEGLKEVVQRKKSPKKDNRLLNLLGKRSIGIKKIRREDIYDDYLRKKISS
ncbi:hypothetical protein A3D03_06615 [Candidatus Gottesmanbacteria bacterium RIFCSPHIGHO2_02_FULL_40_13]|uniref:Ribbon-helix-helix protein CopG domain-containing protein n=1 Tax=Candidatus Gottesmanbacteria bacterium RIFCSPHIGHO2_02_FULL_40_13 TaxID=1798384 RepID=A0A1F6A9B1_9BACT|nr:MAG: hypothetical protein A3D03_06615 [Candidatus Gottesmanbacteria bacterium RIFCSPHIGHO2_02_FULL_40_13]